MVHGYCSAGAGDLARRGRRRSPVAGVDKTGFGPVGDQGAPQVDAVENVLDVDVDVGSRYFRRVDVCPAVERFGAQCRTGVEDCFGQEAGSVEFGRGVVDWGGWSSPRMLQEVYRTVRREAEEELLQS